MESPKSSLTLPILQEEDWNEWKAYANIIFLAKGVLGVFDGKESKPGAGVELAELRLKWVRKDAVSLLVD